MVESMSWSHQNLKENGVLPHLLRIDQLPQHLQLESQLQINHRGDGQRMNYNNSLTLFFFCPQQPAGGFLMEVSSLRHSNCIPPSCKKKKKKTFQLTMQFFISYSFLGCSNGSSFPIPFLLAALQQWFGLYVPSHKKQLQMGRHLLCIQGISSFALVWFC